MVTTTAGCNRCGDSGLVGDQPGEPYDARRDRYQLCDEHSAALLTEIADVLRRRVVSFTV